MFEKYDNLEFINFLIGCYNKRRCPKLKWVNTDLNDLLDLKSACEFNHLTEEQQDKIKYYKEKLNSYCEGCQA